MPLSVKEATARYREALPTLIDSAERLQLKGNSAPNFVYASNKYDANLLSTESSEKVAIFLFKNIIFSDKNLITLRDILG